MIYDNKISKLITKLIRLTSEDKIIWDTMDPPNSITKGTNDIFPLFFKTIYKAKNVALYQQRYQDFNPDTEQFYWTERVRFAILDEMNIVVWENHEQSPALLDLLNTIREKAAGFDDLLDDLLDDEGDISLFKS